MSIQIMIQGDTYDHALRELQRFAAGLTVQKSGQERFDELAREMRGNGFELRVVPLASPPQAAPIEAPPAPVEAPPQVPPTTGKTKPKAKSKAKPAAAVDTTDLTGDAEHNPDVDPEEGTPTGAGAPPPETAAPPVVDKHDASKLERSIDTLMTVFARKDKGGDKLVRDICAHFGVRRVSDVAEQDWDELEKRANAAAKATA